MRKLKDKGLIARGHLVNKWGYWSQTQVIQITVSTLTNYSKLFTYDFHRLRANFKSIFLAGACPALCSDSLSPELA